MNRGFFLSQSIAHLHKLENSILPSAFFSQPIAASFNFMSVSNVSRNGIVELIITALICIPFDFREVRY